MPIQPWLQVAGLAIDFLGVMLIAIEWFLSQRQEQAALAIEAQHARSEEGRRMMARARPEVDPNMARHLEMVADHDRRRAGQRGEAVRAHYGGMRTRTVAVGLVLVGLGFALQIAGAWPA